ncbi:MAG TPA: hypothetical protein VHM19_06755 [Polyangiales bacterium]|jgi:hypothetical protein|nr:hypothetical protein [Polyangiales bacterium]
MKVWRRIAGWTLLVSCLTCTALGGALYAVHAQARSWLAEVGRGAIELAHARGLDAPRELRLNGLVFHVAVGTTAKDVAAALAQVAPECGVDPTGDAARGTWRDGDAQRGVVACMDSATLGASPPGLLERARAFARDFDLGHFGTLRFVSAERDATRRSTFVVSVWSEGALPLAAAFPSQGDAPGRDPTGIPRPAHTRRVLDAEIAGHDSPLVLYAAADGNAHSALAAYRRALAAAGLQSVAAEVDDPKQAMLIASAPQQAWAVLARDTDRAGALVLLAPLR